MSHEPMVLPPAGTGERARRRREREAASDGSDGPPSVEGPSDPAPDAEPSRRRAHPVLRYAFIGTWVVLILAIPVLTVVGIKAVGRSNAGRELNVETDPRAEGYEAAVDPTPTMLVTQTDDAGTITGVTMLSLKNSGGGNLTFFPAGTVLELPFTETGQAPMNEIYQGAGQTGLEQRVETLLVAAAQEDVEILNNAQWASLVAPLGPLTIDNPVELVTTDAFGGQVTFAQGPIPVPPEQIGLFVNSRGLEENDLTRLERQQAFWTAWLAAVKVSTDPNAVPGETDSGLGRFVRDLSKGDATFNTLPVTPIGIPGVGATDSNLYQPDQVAVDALVAETIPLPVGVGRLRSRVLDGTGTEGLAIEAARIIVPAGAEIAIVGNAENFGREQTVVQYYDPAERDQAQRLVDALGVGRLVLRENVTDNVDVTVIIGSDFELENAPGASAAATTTTAPLGAPATTLPVDPFAVTTTVPFGVAPEITPPTEAPTG
ncbi:MAG: LytR C-terminal domain-containing protein [Acidimicrobiales bacterium]|nr:LytR C-terminal domain-containing protein [Acidimicrobiales bacterium]